MIKAVLFDMDGVLIDSKKQHLQALLQTLVQHGLDVSFSDIKYAFGRIDEHNIQDICKSKKLSCDYDSWAKEKRRRVVPFLSQAKVFPGAREIVKLASTVKKVGLATSSTKEERNAVFKKLKIQNFFDYIIGREGIKKHKPAPDVYLKLAKKLGVKPKECIVIEDSIAGVEAAKSAGMFCVAVTNSYPSGKLKKADLIVKSLENKKLRKLITC